MTGEFITIADDGPVLRATVALPGCSPGRAIAAFADPAVVRQWWSGELDAELIPGGRYLVNFSGLGRTMTGQVVAYDPAGSLEFTWGWDHEPEPLPRTVAIDAVPAASSGGAASSGQAGATVLTLVHGPHGTGADEDEARAVHRAGWEYFLPRLAACLG